MPETNDADNAKTLKTYDYLTNLLIAHLQAFISHHRHPDLFSLPDLDEAEKVWRRVQVRMMISTPSPPPDESDEAAHRRIKNLLG